MKTLIIILFTAFLFSCDYEHFEKDFTLSEAEEIALDIKMKTDTAITIIRIDDYLYMIKDGTVVKKAPVLNRSKTYTILTIMIILLFILWIVAIFKS
jgi:hypothetical protein